MSIWWGHYESNGSLSSYSIETKTHHYINDRVYHFISHTRVARHFQTTQNQLWHTMSQLFVHRPSINMYILILQCTELQYVIIGHQTGPNAEKMESYTTSMKDMRTSASEEKWGQL